MAVTPSDPKDELRLVTRVEASEILGFTRKSLETLMSRYPEKWPAPAAVRLSRRVNLYRLSELVAATRVEDIQLSKKAATISDPDGLIPCLECGTRMRFLVPHLKSKHEITADEYRDKHGLPRTSALKADSLRQAHAHAAHRRTAEISETLAPYQSRAHLASMQRRGVEAIRDSAGRRVVQEHRAPGQQLGVKAMSAARADKLEQAAREAGYPSLIAAIAATIDLSVAEAARQIGVSKQTIARRRHALTANTKSAPHPPEKGR